MPNYIPGPAPSENAQMSEIISAIWREFSAVAEAVNGKSEMQSMAPLAVEPAKPRDGMIVYADGTNWNPGSGEGAYERRAGAWAKL
jgi:hypothetical protein